MCLFTNVSFGLRLRVKEEIQEQNVEGLMENLPPITTQHNNIMLTFDRGYGKINFVESMSNKKNISTIATTAGSRHPSITVSKSK